MGKLFDLTGQVALVTGSTKGIGKAIAISLAEQNAKVIINSRMTREEAESVFSEAFSLYGMYYCQGDITDETIVKKMVKEVIGIFGKIDILVNNVGTSSISSIFSLSSKEFDKIYEINTKTTFLMVKNVAKNMLKNHYGRIINISSIAGTNGLATQSHYAAAKAALAGFTKSIAKELGSKGITCNAVAPGAIEGNPLYSQTQELELIKTIPCRRLGRTEDIVVAVAYLASKEASYVNGQEFVIDGGMGL